MGAGVIWEEPHPVRAVDAQERPVRVRVRTGHTKYEFNGGSSRCPLRDHAVSGHEQRLEHGSGRSRQLPACMRWREQHAAAGRTSDRDAAEQYPVSELHHAQRTRLDSLRVDSRGGDSEGPRPSRPGVDQGVPRPDDRSDANGSSGQGERRIDDHYES